MSIVKQTSGTLSVNTDGIEAALAAATPAGEAHIGEVGGKTTVTSITFSTDTSAYASGDLVADTQALSACLRINDGTGVLTSFVLTDTDAQGAALEVFVLSASTSFGTENSAPNISDANLAANMLGKFSIAAGDYYTVSGAKVAFKSGLGIPVKGASGTDDIYLAIMTTGSPTYTASGLVAKVGILCD